MLPRLACAAMLAAGLFMAAHAARAEQPLEKPRPADEPLDKVMGDYVGTFAAAGAEVKAEGKVIAEGGGSYRAVLLFAAVSAAPDLAVALSSTAPRTGTIQSRDIIRGPSAVNDACGTLAVNPSVPRSRCCGSGPGCRGPGASAGLATRPARRRRPSSRGRS